MGVLTKEQVIVLLRREIGECRSLRAWCRDNGVQPATCSRILNGKLPIQDKVLSALRLRRVEMYRSRR